MGSSEMLRREAETAFSFEGKLDGLLERANMKLRNEKEVRRIMKEEAERNGLTDVFREYFEWNEPMAAHFLRAGAISTDLAIEGNFLDCAGVCMGAMVHDFGKKEIPGDILNGSHKLTEEERIMINSHPFLGLKVLHDDERLRHIAEMPVVRAVVLGHHAFKRNQPYPFSLQTVEHSPQPYGFVVDKWDDATIQAVQFTAAADGFDVLANGRSYLAPVRRADDVFERLRSDQNLPESLLRSVADRFAEKRVAAAAAA